jgi:hypothetical protein
MRQFLRGLPVAQSELYARRILRALPVKRRASTEVQYRKVNMTSNQRRLNDDIGRFQTRRRVLPPYKSQVDGKGEDSRLT